MPDIHFRDHGEFHGQVFRATLACAALAAAFRIVTDLMGTTPPFWLSLALGGLALLWALVPPKTARDWIRAGVTVALAAALAAIVARRDQGLALALGGAVLGVATVAEMDRFRKIVIVVAMAAGVPIAAMVALALLGAGAENLLHPVMGWLLVGAAFGFVAGTIAALGRQVVIRRRDPIEQAYEAAKPGLHGELGETVDRAITTRRRTSQVLAHRPAEERAPIQGAVDELVRKVIDVAARFREVDRDSEADSADALCSRVDALAKKMEETQDAVSRAHYKAAREALLAQLGHLRDIALSRERALARLASYQATLDRLCLAAVHHRSADAERFAAEMRPIMEQLATAGRDIEFDAHGVSETTAAAEPASSAAADDEEKNVIRLFE
jgi:hypothetical protein